MSKNSSSPYSIKHRDEIINNFLLLRSNSFGFNDVKIILGDGIVFANSAILSCASDYFATMLSSDKFVEGQTKEIIMKEYGTTKEAMERIVNYIHCGDMDMEEIGFETLLELLSISKVLLMRTHSLFNSLEAHIVFLISGFHISTKELLKGFMLVERYHMDSLRKHFVSCINAHIGYCDGHINIFKQFNVEMIMEILLYKFKYDPANPTHLLYKFKYDLANPTATVKKWDQQPSSKARFQFFQDWYLKNQDCKEEDKKIILDSINLDDFTGEELLTVVKRSGLFSEEKIDKKCIEKFRKFNQK